MKTTWLRKLVLLLALLAMPLQGLAMATAFVQCHEQAAAQAASHGHAHDDDTAHHHPAPASDQDSGDDGTSGSTVSHHLCGHFVLHTSVSLDVIVLRAFAEWFPAAPASYKPYFPEHPRRPPRG